MKIVYHIDYSPFHCISSYAISKKLKTFFDFPLESFREKHSIFETRWKRLDDTNQSAELESLEYFIKSDILD